MFGLINLIRRKKKNNYTADVLSSGLLSRERSDAFALFKKSIIKNEPKLFVAFQKAMDKDNYSHLPSAITSFFSATLNVHIVDINFSAVRSAAKVFNNTFAPVQMLQSITKLYATEKYSPKYLMQKITEADPNNAIFLAAYSKQLLADGEYRKAADVAMAANRLVSYDCCISDVLNQTQKALQANGLKTDFKVSSADFTELFCDVAFRTMRLQASSKDDGDIATSICMAGAWLPIAFEDDPSWNSDDFQELRASILDGSFKYCNPLLCIFLRDGILPQKKNITDPYLREIIDNNLTNLPKGPTRIALDYDQSCNLHCPSCRSKVYMDDKKKVSMLNEKMDNFLAPLLPDVKTISISMSGEALASKHSMHILKGLTPEKYPDLRIELLTNMSLVSPKKWEELGNAAKNIKRITMSVDGASPETVEKLRRGLKWKRLLEAMSFVKDLRIAGDIETTVLAFLFQKDNYMELQALLSMASDYCVDSVIISPIISHGSYTQQEFDELNVSDPKNILYAEAQTEIEKAKQFYNQMLADKDKIIASGKSVPNVMWRV